MRDKYASGDYIDALLSPMPTHLECGSIYQPYGYEIEEYRVPTRKPPVYDVAAKIEEILDAVP